jgi:smad nuclear-interacting protein 1
VSVERREDGGTVGYGFKYRLAQAKISRRSTQPTWRDQRIRCIRVAIGGLPTSFRWSSMSPRPRSVSPSASSSRPNRSGHHQDRTDRDRRSERDRERHERSRRDRDEYRSSGSRRDKDNNSKWGSRRSASPQLRSSRRPRDSRSKSPPSRRRRSRSRSRSRSKRADEGEDEEKDKSEEKGKPNFGNSGLLAAATKTVKTGEGNIVVLKYHEPPEARKPLLGWRLYAFKGNEQVGSWLCPGHPPPWANNHSRSTAYSQAERVSHRTRQSCRRYTLGPSIVLEATRGDSACVIDVRKTLDRSHRVFNQIALSRKRMRLVTLKRKSSACGERSRRDGSSPLSRPFIIDLESTNGTHVNGEAIPTSRYYELRASDGPFFLPPALAMFKSFTFVPQ